MRLNRWILCVLAGTFVLVSGNAGAEDAGDLKYPLIIKETFDNGAKHWSPTDANAWKVDKVDGKTVYNQFKRRSKYNPPHRSPYNIALLNDVNVSSFVLDAKVKSTIADYGHRDVCMFFNYKDPAHFYYVHFGKKADPHANQIFIVNESARKMISTKTTKGTPWDDEWHHLRVVRNAKTGDIKVYFDDMKKPVMLANDKHFTSGKIGIGSFDDTAVWDEVTVHGVEVKN